MKTGFKIIISVIIVLYVYALVVLVWGPSILMAQANNRLTNNDCLNAQTQYQKLINKFPSSSHIKYNLALCLYQFGRFEDAKKLLQIALSRYTKEQKKFNETRPDHTSGLFYYHLGSALYKTIPVKEAETEKAIKVYQEALTYYRKALLANPNNFEAKYNYELTLLRLNQPPAEEQSEDIKPPTDQNEQYLNQICADEQPPSGKDW